ncbi:MAG: HAMP domain-containing sensor histidine kinase [Oscillospiraceae bacterium]|nr:HAMP domain-containing sensor histidine kinase [Oscillospiraceae bacterium]
MIQKLRLKFVAICMVLMTAVLGIVFASFYISAQWNIERSSMEVLQRVIQQDSYGLLPGRNQDQLQLPYFTVELAGDNTAYVTGGTYSNLDNTEELQQILGLCLQDGRGSGTIDSYNLRYLRRDNGFFQRIAFVDISMEKNTLDDMARSFLQIGGVALVILLGISALLAWWATRPVETALRQQRQFLSDASHELKTPLTVILSNAELLSGAALEPRPARWADNIHSEAGQMKTLVEEMLTLARADNMPRTAVHTAQSLTDIVTDTVLSFEPVAFEAGKTLTSQIADGVEVEGDGDKLRRLVGVLLDNAVKYADEGTTVEVTLEKADRRARLTVINRCAPIPPEQLRRLFERFYRADASRGEKSGFGLGLPIAASIVEEHKGTIKAESDDLSTRFIVTLPLKKV